MTTDRPIIIEVEDVKKVWQAWYPSDGSPDKFGHFELWLREQGGILDRKNYCVAFDDSKLALIFILRYC